MSHTCLTCYVDIHVPYLTLQMHTLMFVHTSYFMGCLHYMNFLFPVNPGVKSHYHYGLIMWMIAEWILEVYGGSMVECLRLRGCGLERHRRRCIVSLSKALYPLLSSGSSQEAPSRHD